MGEAHILAIPYPAQGHVIPLMELSHELVKHGIKVTFVNTDFVHNQIMKSLVGDNKSALEGKNEIKLVSIPDGLEDGENRNDLGKLTASTCEVMPKKLEKLIENMNKFESNKITCLVADESFGWALEVAKKMRIRAVAFWPAAASLLVLQFNLQKLLDHGIISSDGTPIKDETIQLAPMMPPMRAMELPWACLGDKNTHIVLFELTKKNNIFVKHVDWIICNTSYDHEPATLDFAPQIKPIGPLLATNNHVGNFWPQDSTCLNWLDQQETNSVIYVAFGSFTVFDHTQLQELAFGLELSNNPFLLVIRPDINNGKNQSFLKEFEERVSLFGKVVQWVPQQKVLSHPSIACFISHCGWNSTMEGTTKGVPFLCWPYFADQFFNQTLICDVWKVGLKLVPIDGIITRQEIACKIKKLLNDRELKARALEIRNSSINSIKEGGTSNINLNNFVQWIKRI